MIFSKLGELIDQAKPYRPADETPAPLNPLAYQAAMASLLPYTALFDVTCSGAEHLDGLEGALFISNHGTMGADFPCLLHSLFAAGGKPVRPLADRIFFKLPFIHHLGDVFGVAQGNPQVAVDLLKRGERCLVYPGGAREALATRAEAYQLMWENHLGFIKVALAAGVPIVPVAGHGVAELYIELADRETVRNSAFGKWVTDIVGAKYVMPAHVGIGVIPVNRRLHYQIGKPIQMPTPEETTPEEVVELHGRIKATLEGMLAKDPRKASPAPAEE